MPFDDSARKTRPNALSFVWTKGMSLAQFQRIFFERILGHFDENREQTARELGISTKTVHNWISRYGIPMRGCACLSNRCEHKTNEVTDENGSSTPQP